MLWKNYSFSLEKKMKCAFILYLKWRVEKGKSSLKETTVKCFSNGVCRKCIYFSISHYLSSFGPFWCFYLFFTQSSFRKKRSVNKNKFMFTQKLTKCTIQKESDGSCVQGSFRIEKEKKRNKWQKHVKMFKNFQKIHSS